MDLGIHDRKLCVLGLCTLISAAPAHPCIVEESAQQIIPSILLLFDGLKRAYATKAYRSKYREDNDMEDDDDSEEVLSSDEDDTDHEGFEYMLMKRLQVLY